MYVAVKSVNMNYNQFLSLVLTKYLRYTELCEYNGL